MRFALGTAAPAFLLEELHGLGLEALTVLRTLGGVGLGDQHVAVRQHVEPARMSSPAAKAATRVPAAALGVAPSGQPLAGAMCTVG